MVVPRTSKFMIPHEFRDTAAAHFDPSLGAPLRCEAFSRN
jgi:hypothetical protein